MSTGCIACQGYVARRMDALAPNIARIAVDRGLDAMKLSSGYMRAVHDRHLAGLSLLTPFDDDEVERRNTRRIAGRYVALLAAIQEGDEA